MAISYEVTFNPNSKGIELIKQYIKNKQKGLDINSLDDKIKRLAASKALAKEEKGEYVETALNVDPIGGLNNVYDTTEINDALKVLDVYMGVITPEVFNQLVNKSIPYNTDKKELVDAFRKLDVVADVKEVEQEETITAPGGIVPDQESQSVNKENELKDQTQSENDLKPDQEFMPEEADKEEDAKTIALIVENIQDPKEKEQKTKEYYLKKYYLTGEKMLEGIQKTDMYKGLPSNIQKLISDAYLTCSQPSDLKNRDFLNDYLGNKLGLKGKTMGFESMHMAALGNTFFGYQMEEVGTAGSKSQEQNEDNKKDIAILEIPALLYNMPECLKEETRRIGKKFIEDRMRDVISNNNTYVALGIISPLNDFMISSFDKLEGQLGDSREATSMKLYLKKMSTDFKDDAKQSLNNFNIRFNMSDVNWSDRETRRAVLAKIRSLSSESKELNVDEAIRTIALTYVINDIDDVRELSELRRDFRGAGSDLELKVAYDVPVNEMARIDSAMREYDLQHIPHDRTSEEELAFRRTMGRMANQMVTRVIDAEVGTDALAMNPILGTDMALFAHQAAAMLGVEDVIDVGNNEFEKAMNTNYSTSKESHTVASILMASPDAKYTPENKNQLLALLAKDGSMTMEECEQELFEAMMDIADEEHMFDQPGQPNN